MTEGCPRGLVRSPVEEKTANGSVGRSVGQRDADAIQETSSDVIRSPSALFERRRTSGPGRETDTGQDTKGRETDTQQDTKGRETDTQEDRKISTKARSRTRSETERCWAGQKTYRKIRSRSVRETDVQVWNKAISTTDTAKEIDRKKLNSSESNMTAGI